MRAITRCPDCETQFFVTEAQLSKHDGKVRCGQCMHVFNAKDHFIEATDTPVAPATPETPADEAYLPATIASDVTNAEITPQTEPSAEAWPAISNHLLDEDKDQSFFQEPDHTAELVELSVSSEEINAFTADTSRDENNDRILLDDEDLADIDNDHDDKQARELNDITKLTFVADSQGDYFEDLAKKPKRRTNTQKTSRNAASNPRRWPWLFGSLILILIALTQSVYFLRNDIAIYYPNAKPYLQQACQKLGCSINLPQQIEFILIDDSDMQEDEKFAGLMHFSSSLINKADFNQAYPNLELTLTDTDDSPVLRRLFKPSEYLPASKNIQTGLLPGEEVKIKLAITTQGISVAGYRVYVTY